MRRETPSYRRLLENGFLAKYLAKQNVLDIGYAGEDASGVPIVDHAIGIDLDYPGYDGICLPFADASQDAVFSSHCYEHIGDYRAALREWYRVVRVGGYIVVLVPHKYLYERKSTPPSFFNPQHKRFYTPARLLCEFESALPVNGFRLRHLADNDADFDYTTPPGEHPRGSCEIEAVIEKIAQPSYSNVIELTGERKDYIAKCARLVVNAVSHAIEGRIGPDELTPLAQQLPYFPAYETIRAEFVDNRRPPVPEAYLRAILKPALAHAQLDAALYLRLYPDIAQAIARGELADSREHFVNNGYFEGRVFQPDPAQTAGPATAAEGHAVAT